jgi:excisionase family DNA binding protein
VSVGKLAKKGGWINVATACEITGYSRETIWRLLEDGVIPGHRLRQGAPWRMREADVRAWLAGIMASVRPIRRNKPALDGRLKDEK